MEIEKIHQLFLQCSGIATDTRKIATGSMFVALRGDRFDANTFAAEALEAGALYVIIDNAEYYIDERTIVVQDSLATLQQLATFHRHYLNLPIVALTGSNGKTTTKELINCVLSAKYRTGATVGNLNNHIGVPLTLLSFTTDTEIGIVEMGANHQKEIELLCEIAAPDFGYITNFGKAHLEGFGGAEGVIKGKSEMYHYLQAHDKTVFVNLEDPIQEKKTRNISRFTFGSNADVIIDSVAADPFVEIGFANLTIASNLIGLYNASNINAAIAIGIWFKVDPIQIKKAIEGYVPENNRSQIIQKNSNEIILDAYNANPSSMNVAIANFIQLTQPKKVMFLGDMFELGDESLFEHEQLVLRLNNEKNIECHFVGKDFYSVQQPASHLYFHESFEKLAAYLKQHNFSNTLILVKGSRGMALERIVEML